MDEINKLQRINPEKFIELCQMHLTFSLDLHNEELSALMELQCPPKNKRSYFSRKQKDKQMLNGVSLNAENICQIYHIMDYLGKDINVCTEGLFRKTGSLSRQQELKALIYSGTAIDFENCHYNVHDLASVLKSFLADLSEPLLTEAHYSAHNQVSSMQDETTILAQDHPIYLRQLKSTRLLFLLLPMDNYSFLQHLLLLLRKVATDQANRMTVNSLATVFAPHILCPRKMPPEEWKKQFSCMVKSVAFMIENANMLFEPPFELVQDVVMHLEDISSKSNALSSDSKDEAVKTMIAFCDRTNNGDVSVDYTNKALAELHSYIQNLPNSARKRKLIKKFQKEESSCDTVTQTNRRHCRSRSVGEAIKRHLWRNSDRRKGTQREYHHSSFDMLASSSQLSTTDRMKAKSHSEEMLTTGCDAKGQQNIKLHHLGKSLFRASKKMKIQPLEKFGKINFHSRSPPT